MPTIKIKETRLPISGGGFSHSKSETRVIEWETPDDMPQGAVVVPNETPLTDWAEEVSP